ncbi:hypothetical protein [Sphingomonas sp.]|uniref:hypothetical protein n=1 Tax=Sphingomonas sp. TaxID=28214 RepID=UPI00260A459F|nr:hypothetical protein [Sphingomonas sp.]
MPFPLILSQVVDLFAGLLSVPAEKRGTLLGRFQHLSRLGFPSDVNTGRGKRAEYGAFQVVELLLAFELMQLGIPSERAAELVRGAQFIGFPMIRGTRDVDDPVMAIVRPDILSRSFGSGSHLTRSISFSVRSAAFALFKDLNEEAIRFAFINVTRLLVDAGTFFDRSGVMSAEEFHDALIEAGMARSAVSHDSEQDLLEAIWPGED